MESKNYYRYQSGFFKMYHAGDNNLDIKLVSSSAITKACKFFNIFIRMIELRGHHIVINYKGTHISIGDEHLKVVYREKTKRVSTSDKYNPYKYESSGITAFQLDEYHGAEWRDDKEPLEDQVIKILAKLELQAKLNHQEKLKREVNWERQKQEQDALEYLQKQKEKELSDFNFYFLVPKDGKNRRSFGSIFFQLKSQEA